MTGKPGQAHEFHPKPLSLYEQWVRQHAAELYRFAYRLCGAPEIAEDLVQETFYEAWRNMRNLRAHKKARAWLFQILRHRYARWRRTEAREPRPTVAELAAPDALAAPSHHHGEDDALQRALGGLSDRLKLPLLMVFMEGLSCQEAAHRLDVPLGTVLSRIHRAKRSLRASVQSTCRESGRASDPAERPSSRFRIGGA